MGQAELGEDGRGPEALAAEDPLGRCRVPGQVVLGASLLAPEVMKGL